MSDHKATVRAIDVGYGHIKFTDGRDPESNALCTDSFPSQSPVAREQIVNGGVMQRRDTFTVPVNARRYEVGKSVSLALHSNHEGDVLDHDYPLSDAYAARLYGALNYMARSLPHKVIDYLVLGLPLTTYFRHKAAVAKRFSGEHTINVRGESINVENCCVYPQPLGGYAAYLSLGAMPAGKRIPTALVVDPGYNTVDWFVCKGMVASENRSSAIQRGMSAVLRAVAEHLISATEADAGITEIARRVDGCLTQGSVFTLYGKSFELKQFMTAGESIIEDAAQAVRNGIGSGTDIDVVVMTGGGAQLYYPAISRKFPKNEIVILSDPAHANVRGLHLLGERLARSGTRATRQAATPANA